MTEIGDNEPLRQLTRLRENGFIRCPVHSHAASNGNDTALILADGRFSYAELDLAIAKQAIQLEPYAGQAIGFQEWNSVELIVTLFAAWRLGCLTILVNPRLPRLQAEELVASVNADMLLPAGQIEVIHERLPAKAHSGPRRKTVDHTGLNDGSMPGFQMDAKATGMLTSGSSRAPRLVIHSVENHVSSALASSARLGLGTGSDWLWSLSAFHVGGLSILWRCTLSGAAIRVMPPDRTVDEQLKTAPPTILSLVPTQLLDLVEAGFPCPKAVKDVIVGGAPLSASVLAAALELGYPIRTTYGMTETSSMVTLSERWSLADLREKSGKLKAVHAGTPLSGVSVFLDSVGSQGTTESQGATVSKGSTGRVTIEAPSVSVGEFQHGQDQDGQNQHGVFRPRPNSTFQTADRAVFCENGAIRILSRLDDVIISGGENISMSEIETVLLALDGVLSCRVVAVQHPRYGQRPVAFVQVQNAAPEAAAPSHDPRAPLQPTLPPGKEAALKTHIAQFLPSFALPERILPMPRPEPGAIKITREQLEALATDAL